jgi:hypothetical protein
MPLHSAPSERVAQVVEHVTFNHGVAGSSPAALTNKINNLDRNNRIVDVSANQRTAGRRDRRWNTEPTLPFGNDVRRSGVLSDGGASVALSSRTCGFRSQEQTRPGA